jgi:hypothetical protein
MTLDDRASHISTAAEKYLSPPAVEIAGQHSTRLHRNLSRRTAMSILEIAIASQIWARRHDKPRQAFEEGDGMKVLLRTAFTFVAFTLLIAGLNLAADRPQTIVQQPAPVVAGR